MDQREEKYLGLVFWIVVSVLLSIGALFGYTATKWIAEKECIEAKEFPQNSSPPA